jgi:ornithine cyclodeaminase
VRPIKRARVACRHIEHAQQLADEMQPRVSFPIDAVRTNEEAVRDADLIVTATSSLEPVINKDWISPGAHVNAIGTHSPDSREVDSATMAVARIFVDRRESALNEAGDYLLAAKEGVVTPDSIVAEIGELLIGAKSGRASEGEITLFKSLGLAIEDVACADYLYKKATAEDFGTFVNF